MFSCESMAPPKIKRGNGKFSLNGSCEIHIYYIYIYIYILYTHNLVYTYMMDFLYLIARRYPKSHNWSSLIIIFHEHMSQNMAIHYIGGRLAAFGQTKLWSHWWCIPWYPHSIPMIAGKASHSTGWTHPWYPLDTQLDHLLICILLIDFPNLPSCIQTLQLEIHHLFMMFLLQAPFWVVICQLATFDYPRVVLSTTIANYSSS